MTKAHWGLLLLRQLCDRAQHRMHHLWPLHNQIHLERCLPQFSAKCVHECVQAGLIAQCAESAQQGAEEASCFLAVAQQTRQHAPVRKHVVQVPQHHAGWWRPTALAHQAAQGIQTQQPGWSAEVCIVQVGHQQVQVLLGCWCVLPSCCCSCSLCYCT